MAEEIKGFQGIRPLFLKGLSLFAIMLFLAVTTAVRSEAGGSVEPLLEKVMERYRDLPALSVEYRREIISRSMAMLGEEMGTDIAEGYFFFMPSHFLKVQQESPAKEIILSDGKNMYWYIPDEKTAYRTTLGRELEIMSSLFTGMTDIKNDFDVSAIRDENNDISILKLTPLMDWDELDHLRVFIDPEKFFISRVEIINIIGSITRFSLKEFRRRDDLSMDFFRFDVPEDVRIIVEE